MTYESGICFHCGKLKGEHDNEVISFDAPMCPYSNHQTFEDSGLKRVRDNAEEVLRAAQEVASKIHPSYSNRRVSDEGWSALDELRAAISKSIGGGEGEATTRVKEK